MIPCAVGGSSVYQWLGDSLHRDIRLYSNFQEKAVISRTRGVIKCILWHQGERDANEENIPGYSESLKELFSSFRDETGYEQLPIIMGELGTFAWPPEKQDYFNKINDTIHSLAEEDDHCHWISSDDLDHKGDHLHFDARSQRELGRRYAEKYLQTINNNP
jgi:hypothetical protein